MILPKDKRWIRISTRLAEVGLVAHLVEAADPIAKDDQVKIFRDAVDTGVTISIGLTGGGFVNEFRGEGPTRKMIMHGGSRLLDKAIDLAIATVKAQQDAKTGAYELVARAIKGRIEAFSDRRLNDGDDVWRERELELRFGVAATAHAIAVEFAGSDAAFDLTAFAAACGLHVSDGRRDTYSDCHPGELTWERPRTEKDRS